MNQKKHKRLIRVYSFPPYAPVNASTSHSPKFSSASASFAVNKKIQQRQRLRDRHAHAVHLQHPVQVLRIQPHQEPPATAVEVDAVQIEDAGLRMYGHGLFRAEGAGAAHQVAAVPLGHLGFAGLDGPRSGLPGQFLGAHFAVPVHEDDEGCAFLILHHQRLDDGVLIHAQFPGAPGGAAVLLIAVEMFGVGHACLPEQPRGVGRWNLGHATMIPRLDRRQHEPRGIAVNAVCPGWVRTDLGGPEAPRSLEEGTDSILWLLLHAGPDLTGGFWRDGERIAW